MSFNTKSVDFNKNFIEDSDEDLENVPLEPLDDLFDIIGYKNFNDLHGDESFN